MLRGQFYLNKHDSSEFNTFIRERPAKQASNRVVELKERGGNDSIVIDKAYHENTTLSLDCYYKAPSLDEVQFYEDKIKKWLDFGHYTDFIPYYDIQYRYKAIVTKAPVFTGTRKNGYNVPFHFELSLRAFKHSLTGLRTLSFTKPFKLVNHELYSALPYLKIHGSGDITLLINGRETNIKGLLSYIELDSEELEVYQESPAGVLDMSNKFYSKDFPHLDEGENVISWKGNITKIEIKPRWRTKV